MKPNLSPKKSARIVHGDRVKVTISKPPSSGVLCSDVSDDSKEISFNFEIITPQMQMEERNSAYKFFSL